jgi:hypothetical protein
LIELIRHLKTREKIVLKEVVRLLLLLLKLLKKTQSLIRVGFVGLQ